MESKNKKIKVWHMANIDEKITKYSKIRIEKYKNREKIKDGEFTIPIYNEAELFISNNYRVTFLKKICKFYKIKVSGNKPILIARIYNHLILSKSAIIIQKNIRKKLRFQYNELFGPALFKRHLCKNDTDFFTLDNIKLLNYNEFISYEDNSGNIWGFNIKSLYNLFIKNKQETISPYTRDKISFIVFTNIKKIVRLSNIFKYKIDFSLNEKRELISQKKKIDFRCLELFQHIDQLGNYTDCQWFLSLSKLNLIKFIRELIDIWEYRASLSDTIKKEICYPIGTPFRHINVSTLHELSFLSLQKTSLTIIEELIKTGINTNSSILGASYVLCAFTLVNNDAASALPWLYQSVAYLD